VTRSGPVVEGDLARDGAVCVRDAFDADDVALATEAIEANLADLSPLAKRASASDDGAFVEDFCSWSRLPAMEQFVRHSPAAAIAGQLIGSRTIRLFHDHVLVKEPGTRQRTPWHQDLPYYNVGGRLNVSMWMPVDPVARDASLRLVAGSHRGPWYLPRTFLDGHASWFAEGTLAELPDIDADPERYPVLAWDLEPGDAVFFDMLTVHGSAGSATRRRVLSVRFLGDDMVHAPRPWRTSPPFGGLEDEIPAGAPLEHPLFPLLWTAAGP
jgi:ectoine hydroxylase-related dioxygenase (phytanoyl-CoA dioxygenase family)